MDRGPKDSTHDASGATVHHAAQFSLVRTGWSERVPGRVRALLPGAPHRVRRALALALFAWVPMAVLSGLFGTLRAPAGGASFLSDYATHVRCLLAIPLLVIAEKFIDKRIADATLAMVETPLVPPERFAAFDRAMDRITRWRDSHRVTVAILLAVIVSNFVAAHYGLREGVGAWEESASSGIAGLSVPGLWEYVVARPLFQILLVQWLWRWALWARFLWDVSRLDLRLMATHPDHAGGLGLVSDVSVGFGAVIFASGAVLSAAWCHMIQYEHAKATSFATSIAFYVVASLLLALGPLIVFARSLYIARQRDLVRYAELAHEFTQHFDRRWVGRGPPRDEETLDRMPLESEANVGVPHDTVRGTRIVPFGKTVLIELAACALFPMAPLALTVVPMAEAGKRLLRLVV